MKPGTIESVEVFAVAVPLLGPGFRNAYITKKVQKSAIVRMLALSRGILWLPAGAGLAVELDEQKLETYRFD